MREEEKPSLLRWDFVEAAKEGSSREKLAMMLLKPAAAGEGRGGPELTHHTKLELPSTSHRFEPVCCSDSLPSERGKPHEITVYFICQSEKTVLYRCIYLL